MIVSSRHHAAARRRLFLKGLSALPLALPFASAHAATDRHLAFRHTHTDEHLDALYRNRHGYVEPSLQRLSWLLRDFRTGEAARMDPRLYDILHALTVTCGGGTFEIISGYRSPKTNSMLRRTGSGGVAKRSLHMDGKALDIRLVGCDTAHLRDAALALGAGGVGYYPESDFVHIDTGPVRSWGPKSA
ncbi:YcbK family protein [Thauera linaloolentis]|uniref:Murein endopeptidase K n=1 Tax=Thauera linaloolentis (strain DSM 12138 / JCM 21573 / CCUG 41526 / CIP 105981 / IAM 15112 / NBRC 102519 / 47Lol) TaxID=1123367 RepID=N6Y3Z3_THAL4|nr:DUF882 domain-containing protein [Thauera linaloolentis]ENO88886.1 hypothetical protein C666_07710 [Thauera linaloolentis 47Lol = DSM 12138]MCM8564819.1 DUF882 domain-containing protein [Thauera linaloolentis]